MIEVYQCHIFLVVCDTRSFSAAAERLHLTQPAVSMQMRNLQKSIGLTLFERNGQRIELTEAAERFIPRARELVTLARRTEEELQEMRGQVHGQLSLGTGTTVADYYLPRLMLAFSKAVPDVHLTIERYSHDEMLERLRTQQIDFGVTSRTIRERGLHLTRLWRDELVLVTPTRHPWARRSSVPLKELKDQPLILLGDGNNTRLALQQRLRKEGVELAELQILAELSDPIGVIGMVEASLGVTVLSRQIVQRYNGRVRPLPVEGAEFARTIYLVENRQTSPSITARQFLKFVQAAETQTLFHPPDA